MNVMPLFTFSVPFVPVNQINQIKSQMFKIQKDTTRTCTCTCIVDIAKKRTEALNRWRRKLGM